MVDQISTCPVCESTVSVPELSFREGEFICDLRRCQNCHLVYLSSQLPFEDMKALEDSNPYYIGLEDEKELKACSDMMEVFERYVDRGRILDIGCSKGYLLKAAQMRGWEATGVEICETTAAYARNHFGLTVYTGQLQDCVLQPAYFDLIVLWHTLEHIKQPGTLLRHVANLLRKDGLVAIQVPSYSLVQRTVNAELKQRIFNKMHNSYFTADTLSYLLTSESFEISYVNEYEGDCSLTVFAKNKIPVLPQGKLHLYSSVAAIPVKTTDASRKADTMTRSGEAKPLLTTVDNQRSSTLRVLQVNAKAGAGSEQYRVYNMSEQLEMAGIENRILDVSDLHTASGTAAKLFKNYSLVVFHRVAYDSLLSILCVEARRHGAILVYETDDLMFFPNINRQWVDGLRYLSPDEIQLYYEGLERYHKMMQLCDVGLFSTEFLAQLARKLGMRSWILGNALGKSFLDAAERVYRQSKEKKPVGVVRLGYSSGTKTHDRDFALFAPTLHRLMEKDSRLELAIFGHLSLPSDFSQFRGRVHLYPPRPWEQMPEILASFDINLAPLEARNPFCRAKSELKYVEAGILGIPTLATRIDAFQHAIRHGENGFLVSDDRELEDSLLKLIQDERLRRKIGDAARAHVLARYTPMARAQELCVILNEICETASRSLIAQL